MIRPSTRAARFAVGTMLVVIVIAGVAVLAWGNGPNRSPEQRQSAARDVLAGVTVMLTVSTPSLAATRAVADAGGKDGIRLVRVRIVDTLTLGLRIETARDVQLAEPLRLCLVGPWSAPDDAGLSDRCWGNPDLSTLVAASVATDASGHPVLSARGPIAVRDALRRGEIRCDYPPGTWRLELSAVPLIDGVAVDRIELPVVLFDVPYEGDMALPLLPIMQSRYCGLADKVYAAQGEPGVLSP
jgi:hypothetical protein